MTRLDARVLEGMVDRMRFLAGAMKKSEAVDLVAAAVRGKGYTFAEISRWNPMNVAGYSYLMQRGNKKVYICIEEGTEDNGDLIGYNVYFSCCPKTILFIDENENSNDLRDGILHFISMYVEGD